uniref:Uncharacterized protein n=1 Tax=Amphimedon queenslandica TaxID=400682 RepID=A0A1X7VK49_AMPQE
VVIDELHLMFRITDILIRNLIWIAKAHDSRDIAAKSSTKHIDLVAQSITSCGVTYRIWSSKCKRDELEWTSLRGSDRKKLLHKLPAKFTEIFNEELGRKLMKHWV